MMFMLQLLGVDQESEAVYAALLSAPSSSVVSLAGPTALSEARVRVALRRLQSRGLVNRKLGRVATYTAIDPEVALDGLLLTTQEQLRQARARAGELTEVFRRSASTRNPAALVEVITGADAVDQRVAQAIRSARSELRVFDKPPYRPGNDIDPNEPELELLARGGIVRAIYDTEGINRPARLSVLSLWATAGERARVLPEVPAKMALIDDRLAILPLSPGADPSPSFVVLHRSAVLDALCALFEALWDLALPLQLQSLDAKLSDGLPRQDQVLINLLTAGLPDEAIARHANLSYRTLQRRLRALMERAHAQTRFQLGVHAAANGWITPLESKNAARAETEAVASPG